MSGETAARDPRVEAHERDLWNIYHSVGALGLISVVGCELARLEREVERLRAVCGVEVTDAG